MERVPTNTNMREMPQIEAFSEAAAWTDDLEDIVQTIRLNAEGLSKHHQRQYMVYKRLIKCFRIPTIIASSVAAVVSAGLFNSIAKEESLTVTCVLNLVIGVLAGVELFLGIERNMAAELAAHRAYLGLACTTAGIMRLERSNRPENAASTTDSLMAHLTLLRNSSSSAVGFVHEDAFEGLRTFRREAQGDSRLNNRELHRYDSCRGPRRDSVRCPTPAATPTRMYPPPAHALSQPAPQPTPQPAPQPASQKIAFAIDGVVSKRPEMLVVANDLELGPQNQAPEPPREREFS